MLYVFIVSSGCMVKFDMNLAVKKVLELKTEITKTLPIPVEDQVLLCSGGEELKLDNIVGNYYGAGTDTNPIFLFSKYSNEAELSYNIPTKAPVDLSIEDDVNNCANMAASSNTAAVRATLAQRFAEAAVTGRRECDELVHGQHLQQQGWAAVIANLEDAKEALLKRKHHFEELYEKYMANRSCYLATIKTFPSDVELLSKAPLLPKLMLGSECIEDDLNTEHTLLSWFCSEPLSVLQSLTEKYQRSLNELNEETLTTLNEEICIVLKKTDNPDIKEVKGIEERLSSLNKQIEDAKKLEKDQRDLASWFSHTQSRMTWDPLVLPDLCITFQKQLLLMLENHKSLKDILERCTRAKNELSQNINYRIKYIVCVESEMYDLQVRISFLEKHVLSVMRQYESFHQVHLAPQRYLKLLGEVCRRRVFSSSFMKWATELSAQAFKLYGKEMSIRRNFADEGSKNMVDNLFPGMDDVPPPFAVDCPQPFDQNLPNIVKEDLDILKLRFPELAHLCEVPPPDPMPYISQVESDSALTSTIPSSRFVGESEEKKGPTSPHALAAPSGDFSSFPSEYASMPNEVFSLTSSPFEDPILPTSNLELTSKRTKISSFEHSTDKIQLSPLHDESDGEEFETVDNFGPTIEIERPAADRKRSSSAPRPNSTPDAMNIIKMNSEKCPKLSKARSDGDTISPIQERLKHSDSLLVSTDFQSTEYYIDDSMPSSYTESNATSPLLRGNKMFKSHHMVVAELQKQVEEKNCAFMAAVRFIRELQSSLRNDLSSLRAFVRDEFWEKSTEMTGIMENINGTLSHFQKQLLAEGNKVLKIKFEAACLENTYAKRLEVECEKLHDAEAQIANYEEHLHQLSTIIEEIDHENKQLNSTLIQKQEVIKSMLLEHELELDSAKNQRMHELQIRDQEISRLNQALNEKQFRVEEEARQYMQEKCHLEDKEAEKVKDLQEEIKRLQESKDVANSRYDEELQRLKAELIKVKEESSQLQIQMKEQLIMQLSDLEEKLNSQHRDEIESLRSRYKLAVSTTTLDSEGVIRPDDLQQIIDEHHQQWEAKKEVCIQKILEEEKRKLDEAVNQENAKCREMTANLLREQEDNAEKMKSRKIAEIQVSFNEAINSVTKEKDSVIETLRTKIVMLEENMRAIKHYFEEFAESNVEASVLLSQSDSSSYKGIEAEKSFEKLKSNIAPYLEILDQASSNYDPKYIEQLKKGKVSCQTKINPCIDCSFKISILSCNAGDSILLCYEEKHGNFVVFHFGQFVHVLHTDSLQPLGLKIPADPSERWALGVVTSKEFCIARKPSNRYKMNVGAKFYRVKVKPWEREKTIRCFQLHHGGAQSSSRTCNQPSPSEGESSKTMSTSSF